MNGNGIEEYDGVCNMKGAAAVNNIDQKRASKGAWKIGPATSEWKSKVTSDDFRPQRTETHQTCYRCGG